MPPEPEFVQSDTALTELAPPQLGQLVEKLTAALWDGIPEAQREALVRNQGGRFYAEQNPVEDFSRMVPILLSGFLGAAFGIVQQTAVEEPVSSEAFITASVLPPREMHKVGREFAVTFIGGRDRFAHIGNVLATALVEGAEPTVFENTHPVRTMLEGLDFQRSKRVLP
jgi:hypothetical protein